MARRRSVSTSSRSTARARMPPWNASMRLRPRSFARYMAASASRRSESAVAPVPDCVVAMPMLAVTVMSRPSTQKCPESEPSSRSAIDRASHSPSSSSQSTTNSSPPKRATLSPDRTAPLSRSATCTRSWSPAAWPRLSLIHLKRSRSRNSTAARTTRPVVSCQGLTQAVEEQGPIGEARQGVVERLMKHGLLGGLALRDVADVEHDPLHRRVVQKVADDALPPAPRAIGVTDPVFDGRRRLGGCHARLPGGDDEVEVLGMHELPACAPEQIFGLVAEDALHRRAGVSDRGVAVEENGDVRGVLDKTPEPLLALGQRLQ